MFQVGMVGLCILIKILFSEDCDWVVLRLHPITSHTIFDHTLTNLNGRPSSEMADSKSLMMA